MKIRIIQLPDIDKYKDLPQEYDDYGRFGETNNGAFYVYGIHSSHLTNTRIGGYWAVDKKYNVLFLSPRTSRIGFDEFIIELIKNKNFIKIVKMAGVR